MGCPGHRSHVAGFVTAGTRAQRPGSDKRSEEGRAAPGPTSRDFCGQTCPRKPSASYMGALLPDPAEPLLHWNTSWSSRKGVLSTHPGRRDHSHGVFTFFPKGPEFQARQLCSIDPVGRADSWQGRGRGGLGESATVSRGEGGGPPRAACMVRSLLSAMPLRRTGLLSSGRLI